MGGPGGQECEKDLFRQGIVHNIGRGGGVAQARSHKGAFGGRSPLICCAPPNFVVRRKICFKDIIKSKSLPSCKSNLPPQTLTPSFGPGMAAIQNSWNLIRCSDMQTER